MCGSFTLVPSEPCAKLRGCGTDSPDSSHANDKRNTQPIFEPVTVVMPLTGMPTCVSAPAIGTLSGRTHSWWLARFLTPLTSTTVKRQPAPNSPEGLPVTALQPTFVAACCEASANSSMCGGEQSMCQGVPGTQKHQLTALDPLAGPQQQAKRPKYGSSHGVTGGIQSSPCRQIDPLMTLAEAATLKHSADGSDQTRWQQTTNALAERADTTVTATHGDHSPQPSSATKRSVETEISMEQLPTPYRHVANGSTQAALQPKLLAAVPRDLGAPAAPATPGPQVALPVRAALKGQECDGNDDDGVLVLVAKALTKSDAATRRIILPRISVETNMPQVASWGYWPLSVVDSSGRSWDFVMRAWSNGHNPKPVYVLEHISDFVREYNVKEGDMMGVCRAPDGRHLVELNTHRLRAALLFNPGLGGTTPAPRTPPGAHSPPGTSPPGSHGVVTGAAATGQGVKGQRACVRTPGCTKPGGHAGWCVGHRGFKRKNQPGVTPGPSARPSTTKAAVTPLSHPKPAVLTAPPATSTPPSLAPLQGDKLSPSTSWMHAPTNGGPFLGAPQPADLQGLHNHWLQHQQHQLQQHEQQQNQQNQHQTSSSVSPGRMLQQPDQTGSVVNWQQQSMQQQQQPMQQQQQQSMQQQQTTSTADMAAAQQPEQTGLVANWQHLQQHQQAASVPQMEQPGLLAHWIQQQQQLACASTPAMMLQQQQQQTLILAAAARAAAQASPDDASRQFELMLKASAAQAPADQDDRQFQLMVQSSGLSLVLAPSQQGAAGLCWQLQQQPQQPPPQQLQQQQQQHACMH